MGSEEAVTEYAPVIFAGLVGLLALTRFWIWQLRMEVESLRERIRSLEDMVQKLEDLQTQADVGIW